MSGWETGPERRPLLGLAVAALVLGVSSVLLSVVLVGALAGAAGLALAAIHLRRAGAHRAMAWWGVGLSLAGIVASVGAGAFYSWFYRTQIRPAMEGRTAETKEHAPEVDLTQWHGVAAPAVTVATLDGRTVSLEELKGRQVVLTFWATWCPPCRKEVPHLERLAREAGPDVAVLAISDEEAATVRAFRDREKISYPLGLQRSKDLPAPFNGIPGLPTNVFIDRNGVIRSTSVGYVDYDRLHALATAPDVAGPARAAPDPARAASDPGPAALTEPERPRTLTRLWQAEAGAGVDVVGCDCDGDGTAEAVVLEGSGQLHLFDASGASRGTVAASGAPVSTLQCASARTDGARIALYAHWGEHVSGLDAKGGPLWSYKTPTGVNGAHWADLDGDGTLEMVVGLNGGGGLHVLATDGRPRWADRTIGNVWSQASLPGRPAAQPAVFATEAGGTVRVYDRDGRALNTLNPLGDYYTAVGVALAGEGRPQVVAAGRGRVVAFDLDGRVAWQAPVAEEPGGFDHGDVDGDGVLDWVFPSGESGLLVVSAGGEKLASVPVDSGGGAFAVLRGPAGGASTIVVLEGTRLTAYRLTPAR